MKNLLVGLLILVSTSTFASSNILEGSFKGENQVQTNNYGEYKPAYFEMKGSELHTNLLDFEIMKCVELPIDDTDYESKIICQENGRAPQVDVFLLQAKNIIKEKVYVNVQYMGSHDSSFIDKVESSGFLGESEGELSFVLIKK